jgi:hypothetical protein
MIGVIFKFGNELVQVRLDGDNCFFSSTNYGGAFVPLDPRYIRFSKVGVIKEFPDLKDRTDWSEEALKRFKDKLKSMNTEEEKVKYIIEDLKKFGYVPMYSQRQGHRTKKLQ